MDNFLTIISAMLGVGAILFIAPLICVLFGALGGWIVGLFFSETILGFLSGFGVNNLEMWQVGASLGFVSSFFKVVRGK